MNIPPSAIAGCRTPLRLIFWGGLLCVLDFKFSSATNGRGIQIDLINDFVGTILVAAGVIRITRLRLDDRWHSAMLVVVGVSILSCLGALANHVVSPRPDIITWAESALSLAELGAILVFCAAMRSYSAGAGLSSAASSWKTTFLLFLFIYALPLGFVIIAGWAASATGSKFRVDLGPAGLLLIPVFLVPLIHFFVSTSRMMRAVTPAVLES